MMGFYYMNKYYTAHLCPPALVWPEQFTTREINTRRKSDIFECKDAVTELLRKPDVEINDLYSAIYMDNKRYILDGIVHLTEKGAQVAGVIR
jgi:hypothetical protein